MNKRRTNKLYNYLVNTFGLSKEVVLEHIETRLEDLINKHVLSILQSNRIENMIMNQVAYYIKKGEDILKTKTAMNLEILKQFSKEKLEFAYPTQVVYKVDLES